jgi:anti-sigma B factor antagonist
MTRYDDGTVIIHARGDIDLITAHRPREVTVNAIEHAGGHGVAVDLSAVTFIDTVGLAALVTAAVPDEQSKLRITLEPAGRDEVVVVVTGELDCATADQLRATITALLHRADVHAIGLDLRGLGFIDSIGIGTLVVAQRISAQIGVRLRLIAVSAFAARILGVLGVDVMLGLPPARIDAATLVGAG